MDIKKEYERWLANATADADVVAELKTLDDAKIEDAFYRDLAFGTGGLRGVIGAGTNRMNVYTVAKASQGLADYLKKNYAEPSVAIGYDSRIKSDVFAKVAAGVFAANGVKVNIWPVLMPVPTVSFATRYLHTSAGVMVTASHTTPASTTAIRSTAQTAARSPPRPQQKFWLRSRSWIFSPTSRPAILKQVWQTAASSTSRTRSTPHSWSRLRASLFCLAKRSTRTWPSCTAR